MLAKRVLVVEDDALVSMAVEAEIAGCDHAVVGPSVPVPTRSLPWGS